MAWARPVLVGATTSMVSTPPRSARSLVHFADAAGPSTHIRQDLFRPPASPTRPPRCNDPHLQGRQEHTFVSSMGDPSWPPLLPPPPSTSRRERCSSRTAFHVGGRAPCSGSRRRASAPGPMARPLYARRDAATAAVAAPCPPQRREREGECDRVDQRCIAKANKVPGSGVDATHE